MKIQNARKALRKCLDAQARMEDARTIATPDNGDSTMLEALRLASNGLETAIQRLCAIVPNGEILNPCRTCGRSRHPGACDINTYGPLRLFNRHVFQLDGTINHQHERYKPGGICRICNAPMSSSIHISMGEIGRETLHPDRKTQSTGEREDA